MLKETTVKQGMWTKRAVKEVPDTTVKSDKKALQRLRIQDEVFDLEDSVADNAKMISLLMSLTMRMYNTFTTTQKNRFSAEDRALIESTFTKFANTQTRADVQIAQKGLGAIDKIFDRQAHIGSIVR